MRRCNLVTVVFLLQTLILCGQEDVSVGRKEFSTGQPGFDVAWKHIKDGDSFYSDGGVWYSKAFEEYRYAWTYNKSNPELNYKMGVSALFSDRKENAADYFIAALGLKSNVAGDILLLTGRALIYKARYTEAEEKLKAWLALPAKKSDENIAFANRLIGECQDSKILTKDTLRVEIKNQGGTINSDADDYSVVLSPDGKRMFFATRRALRPKESSNYKDTKFNENIFESQISDGKWSVAIPAVRNLNTEFCETPLLMDKTGSIIYIYAGYEGGGDILFSEFIKGEWKIPQSEKFGINTDASETSLSLSPSGNELVFVTDRGKKGEGGKDIFFMQRRGNKWLKPVNAGDSINSKYDEESVSYSRGGDTLWFSSMGHNTIGGFDIYFSVRNKNGVWSRAVNTGYPLNSAWDELFFVPSQVNENEFYFSSNRGGGMGGYDIYSGKFLTPKPKVIAVPAPKTKTDSVQVKDTLANPILRVKSDTVVTPDSASIRKKLPLSHVVELHGEEHMLRHGKIYIFGLSVANQYVAFSRISEKRWDNRSGRYRRTAI